MREFIKISMDRYNLTSTKHEVIKAESIEKAVLKEWGLESFEEWEKDARWKEGDDHIKDNIKNGRYDFDGDECIIVIYPAF